MLPNHAEIATSRKNYLARLKKPEIKTGIYFRLEQTKIGLS
jgi:hypothetical protein